MREPITAARAHSANDRPVASARPLVPGAHLVSPRRGYTHHGIYVGGGRVVQYGGLVQSLRRGSVEEVSLEQFANGHAPWIRYGRAARFDADEVVRRARSRIGEDRYRLLTNNCEHFCEWCVCGEPRSYQVDELSARCARAWQGLLRLLHRALFAQSPLGQGSANDPSVRGEIV
jgi:hypothetical protein